MNKRQYILFIALTAAFILWVYVKPEIKVPATPEHTPSYIADDVISNHYDLNGFNDYRLIADKMTNFAEDDSTLFENPKVLIYSENKETKVKTIWQLTSKQGILYQQQKLLLSGDVLVENLTKDQLVQTMATEQATLMLGIKEITSDLEVVWTGPQMRQQGVGMWASLITEEMKLNSNIKAIYLNESK